MSGPAVTLAGFAYGEDLDGDAQRSLGYRLLAPAAAQGWGAEVEALARQLQATPFPTTGRRRSCSVRCCWPTAAAWSPWPATAWPTTRPAGGAAAWNWSASSAPGR